MTASNPARMMSLQQHHHVLLWSDSHCGFSSRPASAALVTVAGRNSVLCNVHHGGRKDKSSDGSPDSSTAGPGAQIGSSKGLSRQGQGRRRNCLNLDFRHATTAEQRSLLRGMYNQQEQQGHGHESPSPWYPVSNVFENVVHGVTSSSSILEKSITLSSAYYDHYKRVMQEGCGVEDAYWEVVVADVREACDMFLQVYINSKGEDGYVSVEVAPYLAHDGVQTLEATKWLHRKVGRPNVYIRIPSTPDCLPAVENAISLGISVNSTLIFSLERYEAVAEAYLQGLESVDPTADLSHISGVASFFVSRVDTFVTQKLEELGTIEALSYRGKAASALAALAFEIYQDKFSGPRWEALAKRGAKKQRLLWASTSAQNPAYPGTLYVVPLLRQNPDTVNTVPATANHQEAFLKHVKGVKTEDCQGYDQKEDSRIWRKIQELGACWSDVAQFLEEEGIKSNQESFESTLTALVKADLEDLFSK